MTTRHNRLKAVCLGGGHGLHVTLEAMRLITTDVTAVVCVGDDGGSSGRLREEFPGLLPPGDIRKALCALASENARKKGIPELLEHRFVSAGPLNGHSLGNLILTAQWQNSDDVLQGIRNIQNMFGVDGTVLPGAAVPLNLFADVEDARTGKTLVVRSQRRIAKVTGRIRRLRIVPADPPVFPEVVEAIESADVVTLGPGSWYTSLLVHLLAPGIRRALKETDAKTVLIMNLVPDGETTGLDERGQIESFREYADGFVPSVILADSHLEVPDSAVPSGSVLVRERLASRNQQGMHDVVSLSVGLENAIDAVS